MKRTRRCPGWKSQYDGQLYVCGAEAVGYGNPASCPEFQKANPGAGRMLMLTVMIDVEEDVVSVDMPDGAVRQEERIISKTEVSGSAVLEPGTSSRKKG